MHPFCHHSLASGPSTHRVTMARCTVRRLLGLAVFTVLASYSAGSYIITTPRKWPSGEDVQVCLFSVGAEREMLAEGTTRMENTVEVHVSSSNPEEEDPVPAKFIEIPQGKTEACQTVVVPEVSRGSGILRMRGVIGGKEVNHNETISFATTLSETFVQTDKFLYMPGQKVQFRVLTITGPYLKVFSGVYPAIWIESPSGSRVAQWIDVDNSAGLIHKEFQLISEPEEGTYKINVQSPVGGRKVVQTFKVEEFVLPRFGVTVEALPFILGSANPFSYKVCATYTYGQPVKGNVTFRLETARYGRTKNLIETKEINGCRVFNISGHVFNFYATSPPIDGVYILAYRVGVSATVAEAGTGQEAKAEKQIKLEGIPLKFSHIGKEEYVKPNLPYTGEFKVELPSGIPAENEPVNLCYQNTCKTYTTDAQGRVKYIFPRHQDFSLTIKSQNHKITSPQSDYPVIMYESTSWHYVKRYHSPSGSGLVIQAPEVKLRCQAGEAQEFSVPVFYAAAEGTSASLTIQLVSRGQIQYSHTQEHTFTQSDLPLDDSLFLVKMSPLTPGIVRGTVNLPITVPLTSSPTAKLIVWYTRNDGEVVSDTQKIQIKKCLTNPVSLAWSAARAGPGDAVDLAVTAEPESLCSLGVVDKSVELLSSNEDRLTLQGVFDVAERAVAGETENTQIDDHEYCRRKKLLGDMHFESHSTRYWHRRARPAIPLLGRVDNILALRQARRILLANRAARRTSPIVWTHPKRVSAINDPGMRSSPRPVPLAFEEQPRLAKRSVIWPEDYYPDQVDAIKMFEKSGLFVFTDLKVETRPCRRREVYYASYPSGSKSSAAAPPSTVEEEEPPRAQAPKVMSYPNYAVTDTSYIFPEEEEASIRSYFPDTWLWTLSFIPNGTHTQELTLPHTITEWVGKAVCIHPEKGVGLSKKTSITTFTPFFIDLTLPPSVQRGEILPVKISVFNYLDESLPIKVILEASEEYDILEEPDSRTATGTRSSCIPSQDKVVHTVRVKPKVLGDMNLTVVAFVDEMYPEVCGPEYVISKRDHIIKSIRVELEGFPQEKVWTKYMCTEETSAASWRLEAPSIIVPDSTRGFVTVVGDLLGPTLDNLDSLVAMPYGCGEQNMIKFAPNIFVLQYLEAAGTTTSEIADKSINFMNIGYQRELRYRHEDGSFSAFGTSDASGSTWLTAFVLKSFAQAQQFIAIDANDIDMSRDWLKGTQMENGCFLSKGKVLHKAMKGGIAGTDNPAPLTAYILAALLEAGELTTSRAVSEAAFCLINDTSDESYTLALKTYALALAGAPEAASLLTQLLAKATTTPEGLYWELPSTDGKSVAANVETAAYTLLAMATLSPTDYLTEMQKVVKWISSKRNGQGGFVSTQDTVLALQALAKFEIVKGSTHVNVSVLAYFDGLEHTFRINEDNKLLLQRADLTSFPTTVTADIVGEGCALVQAVLRYNTPVEDPSNAFTLSVTTETAPDDSCVTKKIKVCASYTLPDLKSNMALIEVNLISGYIPSKDDLKQVVGYGTGLIKRYEVDGRKVTFYIDEFSPEELCVAFRATHDVDVEDPKPGTVRVYDYYDPALFVSEKYTFPPNDECVSNLEAAADI